MTDPYQVLGVAQDADTTTIRTAYLELVRRHSPERDPKRFAEIRAAYEQLRDPIMRLEKRLFSLESSQALDDLVAATRIHLRDSRIPTKVLLSLTQQ